MLGPSGSDSVNRICRGYLCRPSRSFDHSISSSAVTPPASLIYRSRRGRTDVTWSLTLEAATGPPGRTRIFLRLRMAPVRHQRLARTAGELIDALTVAGMAAGLKERLTAQNRRVS